MFARIVGDELQTSATPEPGYKPIVYAAVPEFDQERQYVVQSPPVDEGARIYLGVVVSEVSDWEVVAAE